MDLLRGALEERDCRPRGSSLRLRARCPVHQGQGLTLAVSQGRRGSLVKCHAGCDTADVLAALGLCTEDLFDEPRRPSAGWIPRPRMPEPTPAERVGAVIVRAIRIEMLRDAIAGAVPLGMPLPAEERVELAEYGSVREADEHYWRTLARYAALACDEQYVRQAYAQRDKWLATDKYEDKPSHEQFMVLMTRAEDLARQAAAAAVA